MFKLKLVVMRLLIKVLKVLNRGSSLPGNLDERFNFGLVKDVCFSNQTVIFVMGTNGKTTTANLLTKMLGSKYTVISNSAGANMVSGVKTEIIKNLSFSGRVTGDICVFEVDEKSLKNVVKFCKPDQIVITNFFRDQLDRYGEIDSVICEIRDVIKTLDCELLLNGNDPLIFDYFGMLENKILYYEVLDHSYSCVVQDKIVEIKYCPICHSVLNYEYYHYGHIGKFSCSDVSCSFVAPKSSYKVNLDFDSDQFYVNQNKFSMLRNAPVYFYFNVVQALIISDLLGIKEERCQKVISDFKFPKGRSQTLLKGDVELYFNLAKNVVGFEETFEFLNKRDIDKFDLLICFNDNYADGLDVSWIWDTNVSVLLDKINVLHIIGVRRYDMALRFEMEGFENIVVSDDFKVGAREFLELDSCRNKVVLSNYTPLVEIDKIIMGWLDE